MKTRATKFNKIVLFLFAFTALASLAFASPTAAKTIPNPEPVPGIVPNLCTKNCLRVTEIDMQRRDSDVVITTVTVEQFSSPSSSDTGANGVTVFGYWSLPNGSHVKASAQTNALGQVAFKTQQMQGVYSFTIVDVQKTGYTFDKLNSILKQWMK